MIQHDSWEQLERLPFLTSSHLKVHLDTVKLPNGKIIDDYTVVELHDVVIVVATDPQGNVLVLHEYRYAVDQTLLNLPAGTIKRGSEDLQKAALRELQEETGYSTKNITKVGTLYEYPTKCLHTVTVFRAKDIQKTARTAHEDTEQIHVTFMTPQQIKQAVFSNQVKTASIMSALVMALPELFGGAKTDAA